MSSENFHVLEWQWYICYTANGIGLTNLNLYIKNKCVQNFQKKN
jgi:hypothetical protein